MSRDNSSQLRSLTAGGVAGVGDVLVAYPFDLVTVRLQTAPKGSYSGPIDVARRAIAAHGGIRGLYHGASAPLLGVTPLFALSFWAYEVGQQFVRSWSSPTSHATTGAPEQLSLGQIAIAGVFSSFPFVAIGTPLDRIKILLNLQAAPVASHGGRQAQVPSGFFKTLRHLIRQHGVFELYRGFGIATLMDLPAGAMYFVTYEGMKRALCAEDSPRDPPWYAYMLAGSTAHVAMVGSVFPLDTMKTRIQGAHQKVKLKHVARQLWRSGGIPAFYPGMTTALIREIPAGAVTFLGYELVMKALGGSEDV